MTENKVSYGDEPKQWSATDYPRLAAWLERWGGRRLWAAPASDHLIEAWQLRGGRGVLIEIYAGGHGWEIWSNHPGLDIDETFATPRTALPRWRAVAERPETTGACASRPSSKNYGRRDVADRDTVPNLR